MSFEMIAHPFSPSRRGVCIFPVEKPGTELVFTACGKMKALHITVLMKDGEVIQGKQFINAAHALGLPLLFEEVE